MDEKEMAEVRQVVTEMLLSSIGPMSAMLTSQYSTMVTALIDARKEFLKAGWEEWQIAEILVAMAGGKARPRS